MEKQEKRKASGAYLAKLRDPRWQKKRLEILNRDAFKCQFCGETEETLHIHHKAYERGKDPWDYPDWVFVTICESCHELEHEDRYELERQFCKNIRAMGISTADLSVMLEHLGRETGNPYTKEIFKEGLKFLLMTPSKKLLERMQEFWHECAETVDGADGETDQ